MVTPITSSSGSSGAGTLGSILGSIRLNDVLNALQNGVQAINNLSNSVTTKISSVITANPGGSSGQVQFNNSGAFGGFTLGGDATLVSSAGTLTIASHAVTYGKMQAESATTLLGNPTGTSTSPSEITIGTGLSFSGSTLINTISSAPASGLTFLGTVTTASSQIIDTSTTTNILAANSTTYRSFRLVLKNVVPQSTAILLLQVHSGGSIQVSSYNGFVIEQGGGTQVSSTGGVGVPMTTFRFSTAAPGCSGELTVSNLSSNANLKMWTGSLGVTTTIPSAAADVTNFTGWWTQTGAIDGFQLSISSVITAASSPAFAAGSVDIYGML